MGSSPDTYKPATRPEREVDTNPEDIVLGSTEDQPGDLKIKGKRALIRPKGGSGVGTGAGLNM